MTRETYLLSSDGLSKAFPQTSQGSSVLSRAFFGPRVDVLGPRGAIPERGLLVPNALIDVNVVNPKDEGDTDDGGRVVNVGELIR